MAVVYRSLPPLLARGWHEPPPWMSVASVGRPATKAMWPTRELPGHRGRRPSAGRPPSKRAAGVAGPRTVGWGSRRPQARAAPGRTRQRRRQALVSLARTGGLAGD